VRRVVVGVAGACVGAHVRVQHRSEQSDGVAAFCAENRAGSVVRCVPAGLSESSGGRELWRRHRRMERREDWFKREVGCSQELVFGIAQRKRVGADIDGEVVAWALRRL
jgi:hypothetical protein